MKKKVIILLMLLIGTATYILAETGVHKGTPGTEQVGFRVYWPTLRTFSVVEDSIVLLDGGFVEYQVAVPGEAYHALVTQKASSNPARLAYSFGDIPTDEKSLWAVRTISLRSGETATISLGPSHSFVNIVFEKHGTIINIFYSNADSTELIVALAEQLR